MFLVRSFLTDPFQTLANAFLELVRRSPFIETRGWQDGSSVAAEAVGARGFGVRSL